MAYYTQAQFIRNFNDSHREQFNDVFFERDNQDIMDCVKKVILSCERDKYFTLKVLSMREIYNYEEIYNTLRAYYESRKKKGNKVENPYDFINIKDSDIMLLEVKYLVRHNGVEKQEIVDENGQKKTVDVQSPYEILQVLIALPRFMRKYYFRLNGNYYSSTFQIVDGSTYNNAQTSGGASKKVECNTFKTLFAPVKVYKRYKDLVDYNTKATIRNVIYGGNIFNNYIDCMYYILANYGLYQTFDFLDIHCIQITDAPINDPEWYSFERHGIFICVPKYCNQDPMVQSLVATIYDGIGRDTKIYELFNIRYWIRNLGTVYKGGNSMDKGLFMLDSVDGIYDMITMEELHLPDDMKGTIYHILRWVMREFTHLRNKDNVDITLKRIRIAEYIAAVYAYKLSSAIHRVSDSGKRVTLWGVIRAIRTDPMYVINTIINMSNLVGYRDMVNDNDATVACKFTYKGISGLGEDGTSIQRNYRYVDPTHAGILDLDASSASDPGMSGMICPMTTMIHGSFTNYQEPNFWEEQYKHFQSDWFQKQAAERNITNPLVFSGANNPKLRGKPYYIPPDESQFGLLREQVVEESLQIDKTRCPIYNINDGTIDYSSLSQRIKEQEERERQEQAGKQLFRLLREDDSDEY